MTLADVPEPDSGAPGVLTSFFQIPLYSSWCQDFHGARQRVEWARHLPRRRSADCARDGKRSATPPSELLDTIKHDVVSRSPPAPQPLPPPPPAAERVLGNHNDSGSQARVFASAGSTDRSNMAFSVSDQRVRLARARGLTSSASQQSGREFDTSATAAEGCGSDDTVAAAASCDKEPLHKHGSSTAVPAAELAKCAKGQAGGSAEVSSNASASEAHSGGSHSGDPFAARDEDARWDVRARYSDARKLEHGGRSSDMRERAQRHRHQAPDADAPGGRSESSTQHHEADATGSDMPELRDKAWGGFSDVRLPLRNPSFLELTINIVTRGMAGRARSLAHSAHIPVHVLLLCSIAAAASAVSASFDRPPEPACQRLAPGDDSSCMQYWHQWRGWDRLRYAPNADNAQHDPLVWGLPTSVIKSYLFQKQHTLLEVTGNLLPTAAARASFRCGLCLEIGCSALMLRS